MAGSELLSGDDQRGFQGGFGKVGQRLGNDGHLGRPGRGGTGRWRRSAAAPCGRPPAGRRMPCARLGVRAAPRWRRARAGPGPSAGRRRRRRASGRGGSPGARRGPSTRPARRAAGSFGPRGWPAPPSARPARHSCAARAGPDGIPSAVTPSARRTRAKAPRSGSATADSPMARLSTTWVLSDSRTRPRTGALSSAVDRPGSANPSRASSPPRLVVRSTRNRAY